MNGGDITFGQVVKERRHSLGLTQAELGRRVGCAAITIRKIEANALRPSLQVAEQLAVALNIPEDEQLAFVRLARAEREPSPLPTPEPIPDEIGQEDLTGRAIRGYELGERIGAGGYGVVYRAAQATVARQVAVKIILPQYANRPEFIRRFEAEAQLVARLEHPHIVPLYDYWREPNVAYLIMRLLRGGSLESRLKQGPLSPERLLLLVEQVGAGLQTAHRAGVIHRDIKPANILLDEDGNAYLADFGIAKISEKSHLADMTREGTVLGSPAYISPEQILAEPVKPQADIYSFGVMLYEMLAGQKPFQGPTPVAYIQQHLNEPLPLLPQNGDAAPDSPAIPTALDIVIGRATAKDPRQRYPNILTLLADLRRAMTPDAAAADLAGSIAAGATPSHVAAMLELPGLENPYKGLRSFTEADAADFFGRDTLIQELLARLAESNDLARFLAVVGPSGSGKSSVVRAGLLPALRQGGLPGSEQWFIAELLPGPHPFEELERALLRVAVNPPEGLLAHLRQDERGLLRVVRRILPADQNVELLLVIDQFEELFTLVEAETTRQHFLDSLVTAVLDPDSRLRVVITLRADFTDQPLRYVDFGEFVRQRTEFVVPLTPDELEQAIVGPTRRAGLSLEDGLAPAVIRELGDQPGMLPLLQYALTELFERREGRLLTLDAYQDSGGVLGALARRAEEIYAGLAESERELTRQLFLRLVTLGEGAEDTRRRVLRSELSQLSVASDQLPKEEQRIKNNGPRTTDHGQQITDKIIDQFGRYRLLTFDHDPVSRGPTVEVAHEALLREWSRLREWLDAGRNDIRMQRLLATAAAEWRQANQDEGFLLRGARLDQFAGWAAGTTLALTPPERAFLEAGLADRESRRAEEAARQQRELESAQKLAETEARSARRLRGLAVGLALFLLVAITAAWFAFNQRNVAQNNFVAAERIRLAAQAQIALDNGEGGDLPALLALRSLQLGYSPEADGALLNALQRGFARQQYLGHADEIWGIDLSPDGRYVVTASVDRTARLWDAQTGQEVRRFIGHDAAVNAAIFSPDGRYVITASHDNTARLWEVQTGQEVRQFTGHAGSVWGVGFSPDGRFVFSTDDEMARLWDAQTGQEHQRFIGHTDTVQWADISPDGRYLATMSIDNTARLWDIESGRELRQFLGHSDWVGGGRFSPDGHYLLTTSADRTARLWDVETGRELRRLVGHTDALFDGVFSPDGRYALTGSYDKTARMWDVASGQEVRQFLGHTDYVGVVKYTADGQYVLTSSGDRTARLWEVWSETEPRRLASLAGGHIQDLYALGLSADRQYLLAGWNDGGVSMVDTQTGQELQTIRFGPVPVNAHDVSTDNKLLVVGDSDGAVHLGDTQTGQILHTFVGHAGSVWDVHFSPDDEYVLTGSDDNTARVWDLRQPEAELLRLAGHDGPVRAVAFSSNGEQILTGSEDGTARLWDARSGREIRRFAGHGGAVFDVAFSADSRFILTGSDDGTARLWAAETGQEIRSFVGHTAQVLGVAFSPEGHYVLTGSADQTARFWDIETGQVVRQFVGHTSPVILVGFSLDGRYVFTGDNQTAYLWRTTLADVIAFACEQLSGDLTDEARALYQITATTPSCPEFVERMVEAEPTWTAVPPGSLKAAPLVLSVDIEFMNESANIQMGVPVQDVFVEAGNGQVVRPEVLNEETLPLPVYRSAVEVPQDFFEPPWDTGPYPKGEPLGFTLGEYVAATGRGTYTARGDRAEVDLTFDHLSPGGLYTLWCNVLSFAQGTMSELPCLAPDASVYEFTADETGHAEITMDIAAFPPSTEEAIYEIAVAYHSDGRTYGFSMGEHGRNSHGLLFYDFMPPEEEQAGPALQSQAAEDSSAVAREWLQLLVDRVQADKLSPPVAARIYAYAGVTLYEAVVPGAPDYQSLQGQLTDMPALPEPEDGLYNWPAVAASAVATVAQALFESSSSQAAFEELTNQQLAALADSGLATDIIERSTLFGRRLGEAVIVWIEADGYDELRFEPYTSPVGPGLWVPTSVSRTRPTTPYWAELRPFVLTAADACQPPPPLPYSEEPTSDFYAQARQVYDTSQALTAEQKAIALYWADGPGMTGTPPGHWMSIVNQISTAQQLSLEETVELHALVGLGLADAFISCWQEKYRSSLIRPVSYIQAHIDPDWEPLVPTPPFPEYTSGHSVASAAAAEILTALLGPMAFTDTTHQRRGLGTRHFTSFAEAAEEAAISRLYGGIHYDMAIEHGLTQGRCIGQTVLARVQSQRD